MRNTRRVIGGGVKKAAKKMGRALDRLTTLDTSIPEDQLIEVGEHLNSQLNSQAVAIIGGIRVIHDRGCGVGPCNRYRIISDNIKEDDPEGNEAFFNILSNETSLTGARRITDVARANSEDWNDTTPIYPIQYGAGALRKFLADQKEVPRAVDDTFFRVTGGEQLPDQITANICELAGGIPLKQDAIKDRDSRQAPNVVLDKVEAIEVRSGNHAIGGVG